MKSAVILPTAVCILRETSNTGLWEKEQRAKGNIDGQLKVGPTHGVPAGAPGTNGESRTCHSFKLLGMEELKHIDTICVSSVGKNRRWWSKFIEGFT